MKKIICLGVLLIMIFSLGACGENYAYNDGDFSLTVTVDKDELFIGEKVKIIAILKNLSDKEIHIQMSHTDFKKLDDMVLIGLFEENEEHDFILTSKGGPRSKLTIKKEAIITRTVELQVDISGNYEVSSLVVFYIGKGYADPISIISESKKIFVKEV